MPLIPDIALRVTGGSNASLHLFDAKFRVHALTDVGLAADDKDDADEKSAERAGSFKRADIYKMHAYRDAIPDARSVWILYPGGEFRFFGFPVGGATTLLVVGEGGDGDHGSPGRGGRADLQVSEPARGEVDRGSSPVNHRFARGSRLSWLLGPPSAPHQVARSGRRPSQEK